MSDSGRLLRDIVIQVLALEKFPVTDAEKLRLALEPLPSGIFFRVIIENQRGCMRTLFAKLRDIDRASVAIAEFARAVWNGGNQKLRLFHDFGRKRGEEVAARSRPTIFEKWFGCGALALTCGA